MSEYDQNAAIEQLTAEMHALAVITSEVLAAHCRKCPHPFSEIDRIKEHVNVFAADARVASGAVANQANDWFEKRVALIFARAREHI